jgi:hypothetical protein
MWIQRKKGGRVLHTEMVVFTPGGAVTDGTPSVPVVKVKVDIPPGARVSEVCDPTVPLSSELLAVTNTRVAVGLNR